MILVACAPQSPKMSLAEHDAAAATEDHEAQAHAQAREVAAASEPSNGCIDGGIATPCWTIGGPVEKHERAVRRHRRLAEQHRASATALRKAEAESCMGVAARDRDMSPFFHDADIAEVEIAPRTIRVTFEAVPGLTEDGLRRAVECHLARNASLGHEVPHMEYCLLVPGGITAAVAASGAGLEVLVTALDDDAASELRRRALVLRNAVDEP